MRVREHDTLEFLERDLRAVVKRAPLDMTECVRSTIRLGNSIAKDYARASSGSHAKKYPGTFTAEMRPPFRGFGRTITSGEYGPSRRGQGMLAPILERGSRNNKPHLNLDRSADGVVPLFQAKVRRLPDKWFW